MQKKTDNIIDTPWKLINKIAQVLLSPLVRLLLLKQGIECKGNWSFYGFPIIQKHRKSSITLGKDLQLRSTIGSNPLGPNHPVILCTWQADACLIIGESFGMTGGVICCAEKIVIGDRVAVGANTTIVDTDFHPLEPEERRASPQSAKTAPIVIENDVFIGMNCIILKGVTIGRGSVIGAGSVVTKSIPPGVIAAGNPARVIRSL